MKKRVLITGLPRSGKTTLVQRIYQELKAKSTFSVLSGFYTSEVLERGSRTGFEVVSFEGGKKDILATVNPSSSVRGPKVGKYTVLLSNFENVALPCLEKGLQLSTSSLASHFVLIDEIGKMECFSKPFVEKIWQLFESEATILATIPVASHPIVDSIRRRSDVKLFTLEPSNRASVFADSMKMLN